MQRILDAGGTAIDAGVAGCLCACVVQVDMCNLCGIAPIVLRAAGNDEVWTVDGVGAWSMSVSLDEHLARHEGDLPLGGGSAVVPGAVCALLTTLRRFGTALFSDVAQGAIAHARDGVVLDGRTARSLRLLSRVYSRWPSSTAILCPLGRPPAEGNRLRQPAPAGLLEAMASAELGAKGGRARGITAARDAFYKGEPARLMVEWVQADGGWLEVEDLSSHACEVVPATARDCFGWTVCVPGPHSQAPALLQALAILERVAPGDSAGGVEHLHRQAEAFKMAFADREAFYGDTRHCEVPIRRLLSDEHAAELASRVDVAAVTPFGHRAGPLGGTQRHDTTYVACVDAAGNAFSASPSDTIDGAPLHPELGIMVSPRGVQSKLDPAHPAVLGPGRRPRITPSPALALRPAAPGAEPRLMALGCPGGDVILQAMAQAFVAIVHFGLGPQSATELARGVTFDFPASFFPFPHAERQMAVEGHLRRSDREGLQSLGHRIVDWPAWDFDAGAVGIAMDLRDPSGDGRVLTAAADPRRSGEARAW